MLTLDGCLGLAEISAGGATKNDVKEAGGIGMLEIPLEHVLDNSGAVVGSIFRETTL